MSELEVVLADIGELTTRKLVEKHKPVRLVENRKIIMVIKFLSLK